MGVDKIEKEIYINDKMSCFCWYCSAGYGNIYSDIQGV